MDTVRNTHVPCFIMFSKPVTSSGFLNVITECNRLVGIYELRVVNLILVFVSGRKRKNDIPKLFYIYSLHRPSLNY